MSTSVQDVAKSIIIIFSTNEDRNIQYTKLFLFLGIVVKYSCVELLVSHRAPPQVADRGRFTRYGGYWGNKIPSTTAL
jgi:hypothetical protein